MIRAVAVVLTGALLIAAAPVSAPGTEADRNPDWLMRPDGDQVARYYPERAVRMGVEGKVVLVCVVGTDTRLSDCKVVSEEPADFEFGDAAINLAAEMRMTPKIQDGLPVEGSVRLPIVFKLPRSSETDVLAEVVGDFGDMARLMSVIALLGAGLLAGLYFIFGRGRRDP
ncbi:MAG: energy transducer TonB [Caulobacter sp.]|nr:energy transducer TonB [Caulobacter sp.]